MNKQRYPLQIDDIMNHIPVGIVVFTMYQPTQILCITPPAYEMFGITKEEYIEKFDDFLDYYTDFNRDDFIEQHREEIYAGSVIDFRVRVHADDSSDTWLRCMLHAVFGEPSICYMAITDITEQVRLEHQLARDLTHQQKTARYFEMRAKHDSLTHLLNRGALEDTVKRALSSTLDTGNLHAYIMIDVDNFKQINDIYGHDMGDLFIKEFGKLISGVFTQDGASIGRMGGDEFAVFLKDPCSEEELKAYVDALAEKVEALSVRLKLEPKPTLSVGAAYAPSRGSTFQTLYQSADAALYDVKRTSKNGLKICH